MDPLTDPRFRWCAAPRRQLPRSTTLSTRTEPHALLSRVAPRFALPHAVGVHLHHTHRAFKPRAFRAHLYHLHSTRIRNPCIRRAFAPHALNVILFSLSHLHCTAGCIRTRHSLVAQHVACVHIGLCQQSFKRQAHRSRVRKSHSHRSHCTRSIAGRIHISAPQRPCKS